MIFFSTHGMHVLCCVLALISLQVTQAHGLSNTSGNVEFIVFISAFGARTNLGNKLSLNHACLKEHTRRCANNMLSCYFSLHFVLRNRRETNLYT